MRGHQSTFPNAYTQLTTKELLRAFDLGATHLPQVLKELTEQDLKARPRTGKWSIQEIVLHVADSEIMGAGRIRQAYTQPGSTFATYDQDIWADIFDYRNQDGSAIQNALKLFEYLRRTSSAIFRRARRGDWQKNGIHAEYGSLTLRQLLELYADHSERHIERILDLRSRLGKAIEFPILLQQRLY
ncbi:DUF664 domain-containing protein [candidate division KSB1 bacterium]|nr:DUF664 domain-containing protein [candidate division KSB1 bacterium]NIR69241.1 DUF664 domain-containing protein [candidate division KSB1 bacterium]NIS27415.1 DUF664 domain-containing protein [candidate division KSB1 bacterium]NIT74240.1 DUF664 domain-containing protein [candidate division KSB1 bacterium]NIU28132.1 DUF664 domain-containing protein [candidate division KSB1 bacterium]